MRTLRWLALAVAIVAMHAGPVHADRIDDLSRRLTKTSSEKARIAAAVSLGRLKNERTLKPLVLALRDDSIVVRSVAATALGSLGDSRALPALRRATQDHDKTVRKRATEAIGRIRHSSSTQAGKRSKRYTVKSREIRPAHYRVDGQESPLLTPIKPDLFVSIRSAADKSPGKAKRRERSARSALMRSLMQKELDDSKRLTANASIAEELELTKYGVDLSITQLRRVVNGPYVELECELRIAITNERGKMISFLTGGAKVQVAKRSFQSRFEPNMRKEALENAVKSVHQDLVRYLVKASGV